MATSREREVDREELAERAPLIGGSIVVLAGLAVGAASFIDGPTPGFGVRLPIYVLAGAVVFVGALLAMRYSPRNSRAVLGRAMLAGVLGFAVVGLGVEAVIYAFVVVAPHLSLYLLSAAVVGCGLGYWSVRNWHTVDNLTRPW